MVSDVKIEEQLKRIGFKRHGWGRAEVSELPNIILPDEKIFECVNGIYEGGFALLVATDVRVLLIDKKPFNYLTVEDLRFDMINEIDYNHRLLGAYVSVATGSKNLKFRSYNQPRLRKLISHVQHCMAEGKKQETTHQEDQKQHLEQINRRLQKYLMSQHKHQKELEQHFTQARQNGTAVPSIEPPRPDPELSDYLLAQSLLEQHNEQNPGIVEMNTGRQAVQSALPPAQTQQDDTQQAQAIYNDAVREIFGQNQAKPDNTHGALFEITINPLKIAYSKLPTLLRIRKSGNIAGQAPGADIEPEQAVQPQPS